MNDLYIKNPIIAPKVFIIRSSISVRRLFNNWLISISMEKEKPARAVRCSDLIFFQIKGIKNPNGMNRMIFKIYPTISIPAEKGIGLMWEISVWK